MTLDNKIRKELFRKRPILETWSPGKAADGVRSLPVGIRIGPPCWPPALPPQYIVSEKCTPH